MGEVGEVAGLAGLVVLERAYGNQMERAALGKDWAPSSV